MKASTTLERSVLCIIIDVINLCTRRPRLVCLVTFREVEGKRDDSTSAGRGTDSQTSSVSRRHGVESKRREDCRRVTWDGTQYRMRHADLLVMASLQQRYETKKKKKRMGEWPPTGTDTSPTISIQKCDSNQPSSVLWVLQRMSGYGPPNNRILVPDGWRPIPSRNDPSHPPTFGQ